MVNVCYLCKRIKETCNHVLWCLVVYKLLDFIVYELLGINWVMAGSVRDEIWAYKGISGQRKQTDLILFTIF